MANNTMAAILSALVALWAWPGAAFGHYSSGVEYAGDRTASFLASPFVAAFDPAPLTPRLQAGPVEPQPPPGMCRWERTMLDRAGRPVLDRFGRPIKEYAIGSCLTPPPH